MAGLLAMEGMWGGGAGILRAAAVDDGGPRIRVGAEGEGLDPRPGAGRGRWMRAAPRPAYSGQPPAGSSLLRRAGSLGRRYRAPAMQGELWDGWRKVSGGVQRR